MNQTSRRSFLAQTGAVALAMTAPLQAAGASQRLRVGLIGCGGRGREVAGVFQGRDDVELAYLVDPDQRRLAAAANQLKGSAKPIGDFRQLLDDRTLDAVIVATPVHWHAPITLLACAAGKHVYVEKPCSHNLREGRLMVEAARRNNRVVQHGTQVRSTRMMIEAIAMLREGTIGEVLVAKAWNIQNRPGGGLGAEEKPPIELDYAMWLGPVPQMPYRAAMLANWNWSQHFGTGEIGNDGIHDLEYARWGLGVESHPTTISGTGGRYFHLNESEFPDTQQVNFEYAAGEKNQKRMLIYEERLWSTNYPHNCDSGVEFYGTKGQMFLSRRGKIEVSLDRNQSKPVEISTEPQNTHSHVADFIDAIQNNRRPSADIEIGHHTAALCHLGNIAVKLGRTLKFNPATEQFAEDDLNQFLRRAYQADHWAAPTGA